MAADHRRKRLNGASIAGCSSWEEYKTKKKKLVSPKNELNIKSHISLEWDGNRKKVVAKREQIGLSQNDLRTFVDPSPQHHNILADVIAIPREIFEVDNLNRVLSHEVWQSNLSENEREYLMQFLPKGSDAEEVVQTLLAGDNFHFGNPFVKWGDLLCSGNLHPDAVIHQELCIKSNKKAYYSEIQQYRNDMIKYLQKLKETWESSKDPEKEVLQKIRRSRRDADRRVSLNANESRFRELEDDAVATSESCSLVAEEKTCSSDNQNSSMSKGGELERSHRIHEKDFMGDKSRKPLVASDDAKPRKGEKLHKRNIHHIDGVKYMSYLKISKKQHQLVKNMKQSGKSIQSKSLNRVLGNLDTLHVQPYEEFVKEERKKLHEHWLQLANKDLPIAYENWRRRRLQRCEITKSLEQDMKDKLESLMEEEEKLNHGFCLQDQSDQGARKHEYRLENEEELNHNNCFRDESDQDAGPHESDMQDEEEMHDEAVVDYQNDQGAREYEAILEDEEKEIHDRILLDNQNGIRNQESYVEDNELSGSGTSEYQFPQQNSSLSRGHDLNPIDTDSESNHVASKSNDASPDASEYLGNANTADASISQGVPISSSGDAWPAVSMQHSFYDSTANHEYTSASELSLPHPVNGTHRPQLIDLESDVHGDDTGKDLLHRQCDDGSFSSYTNHDRSGLLQSLIKGQQMLPYHTEQKLMRLDFQSSNNVFIEDGHFTGHIQRQLQPSLPLEQGLKRRGENYMQQSISEGIYSEGSPYLLPRQGHVPPVNLQDWPVNPVRMPAQAQPHMNNDVLLTQNWFSGERPVRGGWNGTGSVSGPAQSVGCNTDQSLFSVLSQCNQLRTNNYFDSMGPTEQLMLPRNYEMASGVAPRISNSLPQTTHPLDYLNGRDTASSVTPDDIGWMTSLPQSSGLHDPVGKPYLRSWNQ
ncbi:uncharacterized protein LOC110613386 [Manihot esculenta]|uniref:Uncharacterized protein n=5 Tax=Manihot esculenta TaxID=3983 RepID=A0ACB7HV98_MANES|nr:uncharacterized protein LOC110613386 [Manihot esculenta]KAG8656046.1 hypothetical protein MANES_04G093600v8 [Manihot esculenta]KAG8656047.1 hypothetical protein MANES_04G093600v8 [Manihot esculenta]KAG8656048.1 hypothetical protein MANES_04G093600v8 [Manihot esculenta]KAG8656049.1 hypothetical protein MANES_04G093600v8 [Manihot esculenta]KAG8656050.1 hypothetical protein MANES_04G093600v8 [Manihot esculenta]